MTFTITLKASYLDIHALYPFEGWEASNDEDLKDLIERCIAVCPRNEGEIEDLVEELVGLGDDCLNPQTTAVGACDATIEVDDEEIENPFSDSERYEVPEVEELIPGTLNSKFCFVKVWENSGEWSFEGEGQFDLSKLTWAKGQFLYDGAELDFTGGEGCSSYTTFYRDGEEVG